MLAIKRTVETAPIVPTGSFRLDDRIRQRVHEKRAADKALEDALKEVQRDCPHTLVVETPWSSFEYGGCMNALRICMACRYEEEGSHWSGGTAVWRTDKGETRLGNTPNRLMMEEKDRHKFYKLREGRDTE